MAPLPDESAGAGPPSRDDLEAALALRGNLLHELDGLARRLEQSNQVLQRFAGGVAHDLKAPIANLVGYGELLVDLVGDLDPDEHGDLTTVATRVEANARRAMDTVNELIAYARETSDTGPLHADLESVVEWALDTLAEDVDRTEATVRVVTPMLPVAMHEAAARQLVVNLLSNSLRHRRPGVAPVVTVSTERADEDSVHVRIVDNGPGVPQERREEVFEFGTTDILDAGGSGIGLAACRASVADHGGRIWIEDGHAGDGTAVVIHLKSPVADATTIRSGTVLVAHPSRDLRATLRLLGRRHRFGVVAGVSTVADGLDRYTTLPERPDLVVLAETFPGAGSTDTISGFDLAEEIHVLEPDQSIVVVVGTIDDSVRHRADEVDAVVSIIDADALRQAVKDALGVESD